MAAMAYELRGKRVYVAGHRGMVGSALVRRLSREDVELVTADHASLDLRRQSAVEDWMAEARPQAIFLAAARVGGILAILAFVIGFLFSRPAGARFAALAKTMASQGAPPSPAQIAERDALSARLASLALVNAVTLAPCVCGA